MSNNLAGNGVGDCKRDILNIICKYHSGLNIVHFNARSLNAFKLDYVRDIFSNINIDVVCVSETWFHEDVQDTYVSIPNFQLFRNDRKIKERGGKRCGGGVAIYVKKSLKAKCICKSGNSEIEFISVELGEGNCSVLVTCVYNPSRINSLDSFFNNLLPYVTNFENLILCGDFNVNLLVADSTKNNFTNSVSLAGLTIVNTIFPTRFDSSSTPSLLDYFLVSNQSIVQHFDQLSFISDHDLIFCSFNLQLSHSTFFNSFSFRDYKSINFPALYNELMSANWESCLCASSVDDKLLCLSGEIKRIFDDFVPVKTVTSKTSSCPWFTDQVENSIKKRNKLYSKWKKSGSELIWNEYKTARNQASTIARTAKKNYFAAKLNTSLPTKKLWNNLKKLNVYTKESTHCDIDPDTLNDYFLTVSNSSQADPNLNCDFVNPNCDMVNPNSNVQTDNCDIFNSSPRCNYSFCFEPVCESDVFRCVNNIKSNAVGVDEIPLRFIKIILPYILPYLTHLINQIISTSVFPQMWKIGNVIPIPKKNSPSEKEDYRPITILPCLAKVAEMLMAEQITAYLSNYQLLSPLQSGFRSGHSCETAIVKVLDDVRMAFDNGELTLLCLLDFSKAFDSVDHHLLVAKLKYFFGFTDSAANLIANYLCNRLQTVKSNGSSSSMKTVFCGVPQGSVLGPLLFSMFVNDIFKCTSDVIMHAYADDIQLYLSNRIGLMEDLAFRVNQDLERITLWSKNNKLLLNPKKCVVLPIYKGNVALLEIPHLFINSSQLSVVSKVKNLGFIINTTLTCSDHINSVVQKIYFILRNLRISSSYTPQEIRMRLAKQIIFPIVTYASNVYCKLDSISLHKLNVAMNAVSRYVFGLQRFSEASDWCKKLLGCSVQNFLFVRSCIFLFRVIAYKQPDYLYKKLNFGVYQRNNKIIVPSYQYLASTRLFFVNSIRIWNSLPVTLRTIEDESCFKKQIIIYFNSKGN